MLYIHDKAKAVFGETVSGKDKIKKAKLITIMTQATNESANTHFISTENKTPAHFVLDGSHIVKYNYNTTNVFPIDTKWNIKSKNIIERVILGTPEALSSSIAIQNKPLLTKDFQTDQSPNHITVYYSNSTADAFYSYLEARLDATAYHYLIDEEKCYEVVSPLIRCYTDNHIHIVVLGKNNSTDAIDRAAKLIDSLMRNYSIGTYEGVDNSAHIHAMPQDKFLALQERVNVVQSNGGTSENYAITTIKDDANPGDHIINIKLLYHSDKDFPQKEQALIKFVAEYLFYFGMDTSSVWRLGDLCVTPPNVHYYNAIEDFNKFLNSVNEALTQLQKGVSQIEIQGTGLPEYDAKGNVIIRAFSNDRRSITKTTYFLTNHQKSINQDYDSITIGGNVEMRSKFEDGTGAFSEAIQFTSHYCEPIYPDLTVPPRNSTVLYNKGLLSPKDILKEMDQPTKPIIGKIPNAFDPYPTDEKIAQLEMHAPIVTLQYEDAGDVKDNMFAYMNNRFDNTEKRLIRLENVLSTVMRYQSRLASRISINCTYFGGTSPFGKYDGIRCLSDDLTTDAMTCTLDQCLNCSRYEPILGQFYEITGDAPGMAQVYDDVQASLMTKEEFAKLNNLTDYHTPPTKQQEDLTSLHLKGEKDKAYDELIDDANNFVMNWAEVPYHEQSPHINTYEYDPYKIYSEKTDRLDQKNIYEDGWQEQDQLKFRRPQYSMNSMGGGNFNPYSSEVNGLNNLYDIQDYEINSDDKRLMITNACESAVAFGQNGQFLYSFGAKIKEAYMKHSPSELYACLQLNEEVNDFGNYQRPDSDTGTRAIYFDCSSFASYIYRSCGIIPHAFTTSSLKSYYGFDIIEDDGTAVIEQLTKAYPGDLLLFNGHVTIYAGGDYQYEASTDKNSKDRQICKSKVQNRTDFIGIYRHNSLTTPQIKNKLDVPIEATLEAFVQIQVGKNVGRDTNGDGYVDLIKDKDWLYDKELIRSYIDPKKRLTPELKMQFSSILNLETPGIITADTINDYLLRKGGSAIKRINGLKVDSNYNPVRDDKNRLVWEEKHAFPRGDVWIAASEKSGLNPLFLMAHCAGETGWCCTSNWTNYSGDYMAKQTDDYLFNAYGIWCYDDENSTDPNEHRKTAKRKTEENKWFSLEKSIIEGAVWIAENYIGSENVSKYGRRDTAYFMKWHFGNLIAGQNPDANPATMQYATDISWADQRAKNIYDALKASPVGREEAVKHFKYHVPAFIETET